jgi:hypothetical protein
VVLAVVEPRTQSRSINVLFTRHRGSRFAFIISGLWLKQKVREVEGVNRLINRDRSDDPTPFDSTELAGQYTWKTDQALPGKHTLRLFGALTSDQAATLIQARAGHCRLNRYLARIGLVESALCECERGEETIRHVILSCIRWAEERKELRTVAKQRAGDVSFLLGGRGKKQDCKGQSVDGPKEKWRPDLEVVKATIRSYNRLEG